MALRARQLELAAAIDAETEVLANESRYFMTMIDESVALELLHGALANIGLTLTRPQRLRLLHAIRTAKAGSTFQAGTGTVVALTTREFIVKHP